MYRGVTYPNAASRGAVALEALVATVALVAAALVGLQLVLLGVASTRLVLAERFAERSLAARGRVEDALAAAALQLAPTCLAEPPGSAEFVDRFVGTVVRDLVPAVSRGSKPEAGPLAAFVRGQLRLLCALGHLELRFCRLAGDPPIYLVTLTYLYPLVVPGFGGLFADGRDTVGRWLLGAVRLARFYGVGGDVSPDLAFPSQGVAVRRLMVRGWFGWDRPDAAPEASSC